MSSMLFRLANILNPKKQEDYMLSGNQKAPRTMPNLLEEEPQDQPMDFSNFFKEETPALDDYRKHLETAPKRDEFKLGTGKNILSLLAGGLTGFATADPRAGISTIQGLKDRKYGQALQDWQERGKGLGERAGLEVKLGESKRKFANDQADQDIAQKEHVRKLQADLARAKSQGERDRINAELAEARKSFMGVQGETMKRREITRESMLGETKKRTNLMREKLNQQGKAKIDKIRPISADEHGKLEQDTARVIALERPEFAQFVDEKTGRLKPPDQDSEEYDIFRFFNAMVREQIKKTRRTNSGLDMDLPVNIPRSLSQIENESEDDDEFEVIG